MRRRRLVALFILLALGLAACSTEYDLGVVRDGDDVVARSACTNDQQLRSVTVRVKRPDGDRDGSTVWSAVVKESGESVGEIVLGEEAPAIFVHEFAGQIPTDATLLIDGEYPSAPAAVVAVVLDDLADGEAATPTGTVSRNDFEDDRRACGQISFGFLWPILWVVLALVVGLGLLAAVGARIDGRREANEEAEWDAWDEARGS